MTFASPIGRVVVAASGGALVGIQLPGAEAQARLEQWLHRHFPFAAGRQSPSFSLKKAVKELEEYFTAGRRRFTLRFELVGTAFQRAVWREVLAIPYGETRSYLDIALAVKNRKSVRAVGAAQGANPLPIVVPCHRVIGSSGRLVGYGGGLAAKRWLLDHETAIDSPRLPLQTRAGVSASLPSSARTSGGSTAASTARRRGW